MLGRARPGILCHFIHTEGHFIRGASESLAGNGILPTFATEKKRRAMDAWRVKES